MGDLLPFVVATAGLICSVTGAAVLFVVFWTFRADSRAQAAAAPTAQSLETVKAHLRSGHKSTRIIGRISGLFWFCLGIATLWFSDFRAPWIMPAVGLFWIVSGGWSLVSSFRQTRHAGRDAAAASALAIATDPNARKRLRRQQFAVGAALLCIGLPLLCLTGIRVGATPAALSKFPSQNTRLAAIVAKQVEQAFDEQGHVGLVVGVVAKNEEALLGFGTRRLGDSQPPDADTMFEIGSLTKTFTGILLAQQVEAGKLTIDDRVADLLPRGWSMPAAASEITLRQCTTHTSGLPRLPENLHSVSSVLGSLVGGDPYRHYSEEAFREALASAELECEPGTESRYSNLGVGLLGFVLATQNGTNYETLVTSNICQPLGMHDTVITCDASQLERMAAKYRATLRLGPVTCGALSDEWRIPNHLAGAGAIRSTGRDMMTYLKANMGVISTPIDASIRRSHQKLFEEHARQSIGMNWIRSYVPQVSQDILWHNGGTSGFSTYLGFTEDGQFGVVVLANSSIGVDGLARDILTELVRQYAPDSRKPVTKPGAATGR